jgi:ATP synthase protein I
VTNASARAALPGGGPARARSRAVPGPTEGVELRLAAAALRFVGVLAVPVLAIAWLAAGPDGAISAGLGVTLVAGTFGVSAALLSFAARFGTAVLMGAALGGFLLRLIIYAVLLVILRPIETIHGPSLAISVAVVMIATLAFEARYVTRTPGFYWLDPAAARGEPAPERTNV